MAEQSLEECFDKYRDMYKEITIENTLKILLRCKLVFHARLTMMGIFDLIDKYQKVKKEARKALAEQQSYKLPQKEINELRLKCGRMYNAAEKVQMEVRRIRQDRKGMYSQPFIYKKKVSKQPASHNQCLFVRI